MLYIWQPHLRSTHLLILLLDLHLLCLDGLFFGKALQDRPHHAQAHHLDLLLPKGLHHLLLAYGIPLAYTDRAVA